jgi:hypothetical protein
MSFDLEPFQRRRKEKREGERGRGGEKERDNT